MIIDARGQVSFDGTSNDGEFSSAAFSTVNSGAVGEGGNIQISAETLSVTNGAQLAASTLGQGDAGNVIIDVRGNVSFDNGDAFSTVNSGAVGKGGNIQISADSLSLTNGAQLQALTSGQGDAGKIEIKASDRVSVSGTSSITGRSSALFTSTFSDSGIGGDIIINTTNLRISDGAVLDARTRNNRNGGNISLNIRQAEILNGGQLLSISTGAGNAGTITVNATDRVIIDGRDRTYNDRAAEFGAAVAPINSNSGLFVRSSGTGEAGNINVISPQIRLDNTGTISAESASGNGGNINLFPKDLLLLRNGSQISATAGTARAGGNGGIITINAPNGFIVAVPSENSDITANAFEGSGGQIVINTSGLLGIERRSRLTPQSDITAFSERGISGDISINQPDVDQNLGLIELPAVLADVSDIVDTGCGAIASTPDAQGSKFFITGR
ncbi:MAG: S-layer family protein, partial [Scytonema sp. PMC 1069.18]|nr:S-layer family protein [Scytonema sp. PMC 1069.18]